MDFSIYMCISSDQGVLHHSINWMTSRLNEIYGRAVIEDIVCQIRSELVSRSQYFVESTPRAKPAKDNNCSSEHFFSPNGKTNLL